MQPEEPRRSDRPAVPVPRRANPPPRDPESERDAERDEDLKDTFPASDPIPPKHVD